jgi:hypothetical protein
VKISKTEYAVLVYYKLESIYKKSSKFEDVMVQNKKKMSDLKWNASPNNLLNIKLFFESFAMLLKTGKCFNTDTNMFLECSRFYTKIFF